MCCKRNGTVRNSKNIFYSLKCIELRKFNINVKQIYMHGILCYFQGDILYRWEKYVESNW